MAKFLTLDDVKVKDKVVLVRVDFNSPVDPKTKNVLDDSRIRAHGELTIKELAKKIFGPRKLPELGRSLGRSLSEFKRGSTELRQTLDEEIRIEDQKAPSTESSPTEAVPREPGASA